MRYPASQRGTRVSTAPARRSGLTHNQGASVNRPQRAGSTRRWRKIRAYVLDRDGHRCQIRTPGICIGVATHVDHIVAYVHGGTDEPSNCRAACAPCNLARGDGRWAEDPIPRPMTAW